MLAFGIALGVGIAIAGWTWRARLDEWGGRLAAAARAIGIASLLLLLLDPGLGTRHLGQGPLVLLDNSVSMHAAAGHAAEALDTALALGDTTTFGDLAPGEPADRTLLSDALAGAVVEGRPVVVVTDGEIADADALPPDMLAQTTVKVLPRQSGADLALSSVEGPPRLTGGDTLQVDVEGRRFGAAPDTALVELRDGTAVLARGTLAFHGGDRARVQLGAVLPRQLAGPRWFEIVRTGPGDAEPGDDVRWWHVTVTPSPGIVVLADAPDWDGRALYQAIRDISDAPVRGYIQLKPGQWRRMDNLAAAPAAEVRNAARDADVLAVHGDPAPWRSSGKARLLWPSTGAPGDWYVASGATSPLAGAFAVADADSLPPASAAQPVEVNQATGWVAATARLARRGASVPVIGGQSGPNGRSVTIGVTGLYRWGFRGGSSEQLWRTLISEAMSWLLATPDAEGAVARPVAAVTPRGHAVRFRWIGDGAPQATPIALADSAGSRSDTLRFDGEGEAQLALPVGRYAYRLGGGGTGAFGVEPYADELMPSPVTLTARTATVTPTGAKRSLRELLWLFALAVAGFGGEWMLRRRMGLR